MTEYSQAYEENQKRISRFQKKPVHQELKELIKDLKTTFTSLGIQIYTSINEVENLEALQDLVLGYARFSSVMQREGFSIEAQINEILTECRKENLKLDIVFVDLAISASREKTRPGLDAIRSLAKMGKIKKIYIHRLDRLSRNVVQSINLVEELDTLSNLEFVDQNFDPTTPDGKLILAVNAFLDEDYSYKISKNTIRGHYERAKQGYHNGNPAFGYVSMPEGKNSKRKIGVPIPEYRPILVELFERYASGQYSFKDLAKWMNSLGVKNDHGENFRKASIRDMIKNVYYNGKITYAGKKAEQTINGKTVVVPMIFEGKHEAIIDDDLWEKCQKTRDRKAIKKKTSHPTKRVYLLNGIIFCSACGRRLRAHTYKREYLYYREVSELRGKSCKNNGKGVSATEIDSQIETFIKQLSLPENWQQQIAEMLQNNPKKDLISEIERLKDKHQRLTELYLMAPKNKVYQIKAQILEVIEKIELLEARLEEEYQKPGQNLISIQGTWQKATRGEKRSLVQSVINRVMCDVAEQKILWIEPKPEYKILFMYCWPDKVDETGKYWF